MGRRFRIVSSTKQKLNTQSSTETEIVAVDDCMPVVLWTIYWLEAQGYDVIENIVYQDNKPSTLLENNCKCNVAMKRFPGGVIGTGRLASGGVWAIWSHRQTV